MRGWRWCAPAAAGALALALGAMAAEPEPKGDVLAVRVDGRPGDYRFRVTVRSPDRGCDRYADWWEVVRPDGTLVYRRLLMHSHSREQPFTRSGGPVMVEAGDEVIVRAHLHPDGYTGAAQRGSAARGFTPWQDAPPDFGADLAQADPRPAECWY